MKTIEEKATAYDEAIERAKEQLDGAKVFDYDNEQIAHDIRTTVYNIFPELAESEDEEVRKAMIDFFKHEREEGIAVLHYGVNIERMIAWLEKQGEQKPADKVEQKGMNIVEEDMTPFQKKVFCIIDTAIEEEHGLKQVCDELLRLAHDEIKQKSAWSEEDEEFLSEIISDIKSAQDKHPDSQMNQIIFDEEVTWLKSLKDRVGNFDDGYKVGFSAAKHNQWEPSEDQIEALLNILPSGNQQLFSLYNDLKKLK